MELPEKRSEAQAYLPEFMIIYSKPKVGKSTICAALPNALILDLEDGYKALSVMKIQVRSYTDFAEVYKAIIEKGKKIKKKPYKYIVIDNATRLEEYCTPEAAHRYRIQNPTWGVVKDKYGVPVKDKQGNYIEDPSADILSVGYGRGHMLLRETVKDVINMFKRVCDCLILVSHTKESSIKIDAEEMTEISPDLGGKLSAILCGLSDCIGFMYRKGNDTYMSFKGGDNVINQARPLHLRERVFKVITSSDEDMTPIVNIKDIFGEQETV